MPSTRITDFWQAHPEYHIPITSAQKAAADNAIYTEFYGYNYAEESLAGRVIFLDQFQRHLQRVLGSATITEEDIRASREEAAADVERNADELICQNEIELIACLMPFKHLERFTYIFEYLHNTYLPDMGWSSEAASLLKSYPHLSRFYADTFRKAHTDNVIADNLIKDPIHAINQYDAAAICESADLPSADLADLAAQVTASSAARQLADHLPADPAIVSLSGGIDSMVVLTLLKALGRGPTAVHIIYGNRAVAYEEYSFIATYCKHIQVPLYVYEIPYIRRDQVQREFYEEATRQLRFGVYRAVSKLESPDATLPVILGHIRDDLVENVWTNFAKSQHLDNLAKMEANEFQLGVQLLRPLLSISKSQIYEVATELSIPYLKNTTPSWSNRGKFREHFYAATHAQYGSQVDSAVLAAAAQLKAQAAIIDKLLYEPVYASWNCVTKSIIVTKTMRIVLDTAGWCKIFEYVCHKCLGISRPSIHAVREFQRRLANNKNVAEQIRVNMKKDLRIIVKENDIIFEVIS